MLDESAPPSCIRRDSEALGLAAQRALDKGWTAGLPPIRAGMTEEGEKAEVEEMPAKATTPAATLAYMF
eukprot:756931-Hanusia_phi.AAC.2